MQRREDVFADHALVDHDSVLKVVSFPRHERYQQVAAQGQLTTLRCVTFAKNLSLFHALSLHNDGAQVDGGALVGLQKLHQRVNLDIAFKANQGVLFGAVVSNVDFVGIHVLDRSQTFRVDQHARIARHLLLQAGSNNRGFRTQQRHGLTHHVGPHQSPVGVVVFQERNHRRGNRSDLVGSHVHHVDLRGFHHGEVAFVPNFYARVDKGSVGIQCSIGLCNDAVFFLLRGKVNGRIFQVNNTTLYLPVGSFDEAHGVHLRVDAKRRNQTDVWTFRRLNRAQTAVVGVVNVTHLKSCAFAAQTTGS